MKQRIITGVILVLLIILAVMTLHGFYFKLFASFMVFLISWEWSNLLNIRLLSGKVIYLILIGVATYLVDYLPIVYVFYVSVIWWSVALLMVLFYKTPALMTIPVWMRYIMGFFVIVPAWVSVVYLDHANSLLLLYVILIVAAGDTGAYFAGRFLGKHPLAPLVSPKKTIEGLLGGLIAGGILAVIFTSSSGHMTISHNVIIFLCGVLVVAVSVVGDLYESILKREAGVKDSGNILPGHGGLLDRTDSLLAALPIFALLNIVVSFLNQ